MAGPTQMLAQMSQIDTKRTRELYGIEDEDLNNIQKLGQSVLTAITGFLNHFYEWMQDLPEFTMFFSDPKKLAAVKQEQTTYWETFLTGVIDEQNIANRRAIGNMHAHIGLSLPTYFAAMSEMLDSVCCMIEATDKTKKKNAN